MAGEPLREANIGWDGLAGDRRYAFQDLANQTGLPWLSARQIPKLVTYKACFDGPSLDGESPITVITPDGVRLPLSSPELLSNLEKLASRKLTLTQVSRGTYDSFAVSLITEQAIGFISTKVGMRLEPERFRPNVLIRAGGENSFPEDQWVGELLVFGDRGDSARLRINRQDVRCRVPGLDLRTGDENPAVLAEIIKSRKKLLGVYATTERPGTVFVGDRVRVGNP